jgi:hypothetical protein
MITNPIEMAATAASIVLASLAGSRIMTFFADSTDSLPDWAKIVAGPIGALVCMGFGLSWFKSQLEEAKKESKDDKQALLGLVKDVTTQVTLSTIAIKDGSMINQRTSSLVEEVEDLLKSINLKS